MYAPCGSDTYSLPFEVTVLAGLAAFHEQLPLLQIGLISFPHIGHISSFIVLLTPLPARHSLVPPPG
jgi:hypothetical protein